MALCVARQKSHRLRRVNAVRIGFEALNGDKRMSRYQLGDRVYAATDLYNDPLEETGESAIPGVFPGMLLAGAGTRGMVVNVGHAAESPEEEIYLVRFETAQGDTLAEPIGCVAEELTYGLGTA
jgi:nitrogen fixation protein NifZ